MLWAPKHKTTLLYRTYRVIRYFQSNLSNVDSNYCVISVGSFWCTRLMEHSLDPFIWPLTEISLSSGSCWLYSDQISERQVCRKIVWIYMNSMSLEFMCIKLQIFSPFLHLLLHPFCLNVIVMVCFSSKKRNPIVLSIYPENRYSPCCLSDLLKSSSQVEATGNCLE